MHPMPSPSAGRPTALPKAKIAEADIPKAIENHLNETVALDLFSGVVLVAKDDQILLHKPWGMANKDLKTIKVQPFLDHFAEIEPA